MSGSAQGRCHADLDDEPEEGEVGTARADLDDELEEGKVDTGCHSETDTEEYYNRHCQSESDDETISDEPMAIVSAEPKGDLQPVPLAYAAPNLSSVPMASARTNLSGQSGSAQATHGDAMEIVAAGAADPPTEAVVHHQPITPPPASGEQHQLVHQQPPVALPPRAGAGGRQDPNGYTCKQCGMWFAVHQGLGGHMVGHKHREAVAAAAGMPPADGAGPAGCSNPKPEKTHVCNECGAEFRSGVQLGGHKRKHWTGPPIVPNKKPRVVVVQPLPPPPAEVVVADLTLSLSVKADEKPPAPPAVEAAPPAVERTPEPAPRSPAAPARVLLFGIDIGPGAQTPAAQQAGSPKTERSSSSGGEQ
ncbi:hypothetical protein BAE44_0021396 [Dichanthelium oligosanthes]|uniref:C2H2-type domain-containing protein n=1 Tax=Dichanthelium oligosanthes TaxID=888268 RepID=A0A1E5UXG4_9POAL|nr:hypothetical protein BAE44_0021396 [Dichanthelium oligosanthes]